MTQPTSPMILFALVVVWRTHFARRLVHFPAQSR